MINDNEIWQVNVNGQVYETNFAGLTEWINEGSLLPNDKVRRGNLRWLEAGKISILYGFFNAKELGVAPPVVSISNNQSADQSLTEIPTSFGTSNNIAPQTVIESNVVETFSQSLPAENHTNFQPSSQNMDICAIHSDAQPSYVCESCANVFCKTCPNSYGSVKICPFCGAMCKSLGEVITKQQQNYQYQTAVSNGFGFTDFGYALAYPFKFPASLIIGAVMFMFFTLGQSASSVGGVVMLVGAISCAMLANTLTFGILANTVENMAQGKIDLDFMPRFDEFSLWDDVIHPFFLSIGVYLVSFGLFILLSIGTAWYAWSSISGSTEQPTILTSNQVKNNQIADANQMINSQNPAVNSEEAEFQRLQEMINESRKAQMESVVGKSPEEQQAANSQMAEKLAKGAGFLLIPLFLALLWGLLYFPAACAVAGYTRSFTAVLNPSVGLDTIKHLGFDYVKILLMCLILTIFTIVVSVILRIVFSPFNLPQIGNIPVIAIGSFFHFYIWIVFSLILGFALYKNSARLFNGSKP